MPFHGLVPLSFAALGETAFWVGLAHHTCVCGVQVEVFLEPLSACLILENPDESLADLGLVVVQTQSEINDEVEVGQDQIDPVLLGNVLEAGDAVLFDAALDLVVQAADYTRVRHQVEDLRQR